MPKSFRDEYLLALTEAVDKAMRDYFPDVKAEIQMSWAGKLEAMKKVYDVTITFTAPEGQPPTPPYITTVAEKVATGKDGWRLGVRNIIPSLTAWIRKSQGQR